MEHITTIVLLMELKNRIAKQPEQGSALADISPQTYKELQQSVLASWQETREAAQAREDTAWHTLNTI